MFALITAAIITGALIHATKQKMKTPFDIAKGEIGVHETPGTASTERILEYLRSATDSPLAELDSTPWCAAFVNWCLIQAGLPEANTTWARSFLTYGKQTNSPKIGDLVIFSRGDGGHVGFFAGWTNDSHTLINVLGGNQSDQVKYSNYSNTNLLGFRSL